MFVQILSAPNKRTVVPNLLVENPIPYEQWVMQIDIRGDKHIVEVQQPGLFQSIGWSMTAFPYFEDWPVRNGWLENPYNNHKRILQVPFRKD